MPFNYKHVEDIYALQADFALPNYVGIENNNIPELLQKLGVNIDSSVEIPNKIEGQELESIPLALLSNATQFSRTCLPDMLSPPSLNPLPLPAFVPSSR